MPASIGISTEVLAGKKIILTLLALLSIKIIDEQQYGLLLFNELYIQFFHKINKNHYVHLSGRIVIIIEI
jgi:hypothetical protein